MKKGQMSIVNLLGIVILVIIFSSMTGVLSPFIEYGQNNTGSLTSTLLSFILPFMVISIFMALFSYAKPVYQQRY